MNRKAKAAEFLEVGYNITVTGRHVQITDAMKDYAMEKVAKIERFSHRIIDVIVTMDIQKLDHRVDIVLKVDHTKIKSTAITPDMYASIDKAVDKIQTQLRRYKTKLQDHQAKGRAVVDMSVNVVRHAREDELVELNDEIENETRRRLVDKYQPHVIESREVHALKTLSDGEAIMKMELSGDVFLIFRSEEDRKLKVIYRRDDGNYGIISPEL